MEGNHNLSNLKNRLNQSIFKEAKFTEKTERKIWAKIDGKTKRMERNKNVLYMASISVPILLLVVTFQFIFSDEGGDPSTILPPVDNEGELLPEPIEDYDEKPLPEDEPNDSVDDDSPEGQHYTFRQDNDRYRYEEWENFTLGEQAEQIANIAKFGFERITEDPVSSMGLTEERALETAAKLLATDDPFLQALGEDIQFIMTHKGSNPGSDEEIYQAEQVAQDIWNYVFEKRPEAPPTFSSKAAKHIVSTDVQMLRKAAAGVAYRLHQETNVYVYGGEAKWNVTEEMLETMMNALIAENDYRFFQNGLGIVLQEAEQELLQAVGRDLDRAYRYLIRGYNEYDIDAVEIAHNIVSDLNQEVFGGHLDNDGPFYEAEAMNYLN